jgi:hypothetical protein
LRYLAAAVLLFCACSRPQVGGRIVVELEPDVRPDKAAAVMSEGFAQSPYKDYLVQVDSPRICVSFLSKGSPDEALHEVARALMQWSGSVLRIESTQVVRFSGVARPAAAGHTGTFRFSSVRVSD